MSDHANPSTSTKAKPTRRKPASSRPKHGSLGKQASTEAGRRAAAILEVLAGVRTPSEAARVLSVSATHYYLLERKALAGLLAACEPQPQGARVPDAQKQLATLQRQLEDCQRQCLRQAALVRATQRAVGLPATPSSASSGKASRRKGNGKPRRRPTVRALRAAETVRKNSSGEHAPEELKQASTTAAVEDQSRTMQKEPEGDAQG